MAKKKHNKFLSVFNIFFKCIRIYFIYLDKTAKYMFFPIFGQVIGLALILAVTYYYNTNSDTIMNFPLINNNLEHYILGLFIILSPFLALFLYSFYRYIIAFSALNVVFYTISPNKKAKELDFKANDRVIERKLFQYVLLMLFVGVLCIFPPLWVVLCLSFQIFALESGTNCFKAISRSFKLTIENMFSVILMLVLVFVLTYCFLPSLFIWTLEKISVADILISKLEVYLGLLPYSDWNSILSVFGLNINSVIISKSVVESILSFIIIGFTLPFRCSCFTELYRIFDNEQIKEYSKESEEIIRRASSKKRKNNV